MADYDPSWMLTQDVWAKSLPDGSVLVCDKNPSELPTPFVAGSARTVELRFDGADLAFNGERIEVGDDYPAYFGLMDEAGQGDGEWIMLEPYPYDDHDCPKQNFLDDPITRAYGVGSEMVGLISCPVCDARDREV